MHKLVNVDSLSLSYIVTVPVYDSLFQNCLNLFNQFYKTIEQFALQNNTTHK